MGLYLGVWHLQWVTSRAATVVCFGGDRDECRWGEAVLGD